MALKGDDTIVGLATSPGRGAIAIIRLSGNTAHQIVAGLAHPWPTAARVATLSELRSENGARLDQAVVTRYDGPRSFTGEDIVEIACHGGHVVAASIMTAVIELGAREARPGEFTRRAVLSGKLDILQAEAIGDLVDARSRGSQHAALTQLDGGLSRRVLALRDRLIELETLVAYDIDFPEEDDGPITPGQITTVVAETLCDMDSLLATAQVGELIREGALVVIAGAPNVGKSSLFNALLGRRRAIVTDIPGTTRDALEAVIDTGRWPLRLVDTAGLRQTTDVVERLGIEVSEDYLSRADIILACGDDRDTLALALDVCGRWTGAPVLAVRTKIDRLDKHVVDVEPYNGELPVSAETGEGLTQVIAAITDLLNNGQQSLDLDSPLLTRVRHQYAIRQARQELAEFQSAWGERKLPVSIAAVHLRTGVQALEELIGAVDVEDILDRLFANFCVGK